MLHGLSVGQRYPGYSFPMPDLAHYNYYDNGHELQLLMASPTREEIRAAREGEAEFALLVEGPVIFILYRFGGEAGIPWGDAPFTIHLVTEDRRQLPPLEETEEARALAVTMLIDARTGVIKTLRALSFSPGFTRALHAAIRDQWAQGWPGRAAYDVAVEEAYRRYPTTEAMLDAAEVRTRGGE